MAFLKDVVEGLPQTSQDQFCQTSNGSFTVHPDETGVTHFVLPGFIPKHLLGRDNEAWEVVSQGQQIEADQGQPAALHLWMRAACIGCVLEL